MVSKVPKVKCGDPGLKGEPNYQPNPTVDQKKGHKGQKGVPGETGKPGEYGVKGSKGEPGPPGSKGVPGKTGSSGNCGPPGPMGARGSVGASGPIGSMGMSGISGVGIESMEYFQKYKAILRKQMSGALSQITVTNGPTGPAHAIKLYNHLLGMIKNSQDVICKSGCGEGRSTPVAYSWQDVDQTCKVQTYPLNPPAVPKTAEPKPTPRTLVRETVNSDGSRTRVYSDGNFEMVGAPVVYVPPKPQPAVPKPAVPKPAVPQPTPKPYVVRETVNSDGSRTKVYSDGNIQMVGAPVYAVPSKPNPTIVRKVPKIMRDATLDAPRSRVTQS